MGGKELKSLSLNYDAENDVLYCFFEQAREAVSIEVADGVLVRLDPMDDSVVGFTILDLRLRSLQDRGVEFEVPLDKSLVNTA